MSDAGLLALTQWLSPAFPVGGYAYSHGLEYAIATGAVANADSLCTWMTDVLQRGTGFADAVLLCAALAPDADWTDLDASARALAASRERLAETLTQGAAFTEATNALNGTNYPAVSLPVAVGRSAQALDMPPQQVASLYLQSFASNLVSGAVRFVPLGQSDGQAVLLHLHPVILAVAKAAANASPEEITTAVPGADIAAMAHETMDVRIFKT